jgi:hypothetical protein
MPRIPRSERDVRTSGQPLPYSTGEGYEVVGRAVSQMGRGLASLGDGLNAEFKAAEKERNDLDMMEARLMLSDFKGNQDQAQIDYDANIGGDGRDHTAKRLETYDTEAAGVYERLPKNEKARRFAELHLQNWRNSYGTRSYRAQMGHINTYKETELGNAAASQIVPNISADPESLNSSLTGLDRMLEMPEARSLPPAAKARIRDGTVKLMTERWIAEAKKAQVNGGPDMEEAAKGMIQKYRERFMKEGGQPQGFGPLKEVDRSQSGLRTGGQSQPKGIVFHYTGGTTVDGAIDTLRKRGLSYNYLIDKDGTVHTVVPAGTSALHMRPSEKNDLGNANAIGISYVGKGEDDITPEQRSAGRSLAARDAQAFNISQANVFGHGELNSHKEGREGATDARWIRERGFGVDRHDPQPKLVEGPTPVGQRGITQFAGMKGEGTQVAQAEAGKVPGPVLNDITGLPNTNMSRSDGVFTRALLHNMNKIAKHAEEAREAVRGAQRVGDFIEGRQPFNPYNAEDKKLVDETVANSPIGEQLFNGDTGALARSVELSQRLGYLPKPIAESVRGMLRDKDPARQGLGYEAGSAILAKMPNAFDKMEGGNEVKQKLDLYTSLKTTRGLDTKQALERMAYYDSDEWAKLEKERKKDADEKTKALTESDIASAFDPNWLPFNSPGLSKVGSMNVKMMAEFREAYRENFIRYGDDKLAKQMAFKEMGAAWGISGVSGSSQVVKYPVEKFYPRVHMTADPKSDPAGGHEYISEQLVAEVKKATGKDIPADRILVQADDRSAREMMDGWTDGRGQMQRAPRYVVIYTDDKGYPQMLPGRWAPDAEAAREELQKKFKGEREKALPQQTGEAVPSAVPEKEPAHLRMGRETQDLIKEGAKKTWGWLRGEPGPRIPRDDEIEIPPTEDDVRSPNTIPGGAP